MHGTCAEHDNEELHHTEEQRSDRPAYAITHIVAPVRVTLLRGKVNEPWISEGAISLSLRTTILYIAKEILNIHRRHS